MQSAWYKIDNVDDVPSPALLIYKDRVVENIRRMLAMIDGDAARLRPHIKTHKIPEIVQLHVEQGITKFKCATIAEAEMLAAAGGSDILLAYQPVGPNIDRLIQLVRKASKATFSTIVDNEQSIAELSKAAMAAGMKIPAFLDIDCGMHRTGVALDRAGELYQQMAQSPGLRPAGLHAYDGHLHDADPAVRTAKCEEQFKPVLTLQSELMKRSLSVPTVIAGGTPTFPMHARRGPHVECSPGTCVLWDYGYSSRLADIDFLHATLVLTRVVSKPGPQRICLDLGHKAIASENPHPRVHLLDLPAAKFVMHSEEHLVVETEEAERFRIGDVLYGVPWHVCPTVALHSEAAVISSGRAAQQWNIAARVRRLTV